MKKHLNLLEFDFPNHIPVWLKTTRFLSLLLVIVCCLRFSGAANAQQTDQRTISGKVTDTKGEPVAGATVLLVGTTKGVVTDVNGKYSLTALPDRGTIKFTFVGMADQAVAYTNQTTIDIVMDIETIGLNELVVVGYGTQKKVTVTGSTAVVKNADLIISPAPTVTQALAGKAPGIMTRMPDGRPGNSSALQIRNMGTPLYVIDGNQATEAAFNNLDMNDIQDISILKDASAAIYGIMASNGVVLVTTKKGKTGEKTKINVNTYYGWQNWTRFARASDQGTFVFAKATAEVNNTMAAKGTGASTTFSQSDIAKWQAGTEPGYIGTDWYDFAVVKNAPQSYFNINASGGTEATTYYLSLSRLNQDGSFRQYNFNRMNLQANIESKIGKGITVGARISGQFNNTNSPAAPGDVMWNPLYGLYRNYPTWQAYANNNTNYVNHTQWDESQHALFRKNIIGYYEQIYRNFSPILYAEYQTPLKGLTARFQYTFGMNQGNYDRFQYTYKTYTYNAGTDLYNVTGGISTGSHAKNSTLTLSNAYQAQLNYAATFGSHSITATYVFEARDNETPSNISVGSKSSSNYLELIQYSELTSFSNTWNASSMLGHVGRINYNYKSKYLFELSGRYDASYKFPPNHRYGLFPSVALGWRLSEESFYKTSKLSGVLDNFKIRTSYGMMGNDSPGSYNAFDYLDGYDYNMGSQVFNNSLIVGTDLRNPGVTNISWAKAYIFNVGIDWSIKKGVLSGELDFFRRDITGLSAQRTDVLIPEELNIILPYENLNAEMQHGFDGVIRHNGRAGDFSYTVSANAGYSRAKTTEVYKPRFGNSWDQYRTAVVDRYQNITWLYECIGQFKSMEEINTYPVNIDGQGNRTLLPGDLIYKDFNNDGIISNLDMRPLGYGRAASDPWGWGTSRTGLPNFSFGLTGNLSWKGFDFNVSFQGATMMTFIREWELRNPLQGDANSSTRVLTDSWHQEDIFNPGDNSWIAAKYPAIRTNQAGHSNGNKASTFWADNVTYMRLRNLDIGYNIPKKLINRMGIQSLRVYANGYNLFSIDNLKPYGVDPEVSTTSGLQYPQSRVINLGANITF
jgi:TonB-linked SusC/RagA family outer membrane protein